MGVIVEPTQAHNLFNHLPIIGTAIGLVVMIYGLLMKSTEVRRIGLLVFSVMALTVMPANITGEDAEDPVEDMAPTEQSASVHDLIHEHEELAETLVPLGLAAGILGLFAFFFERKFVGPSKIVGWVVLALGVIMVIQAIRVGHAGGIIRRPELSGTPAAAPVSTGEHE